MEISSPEKIRRPAGLLALYPFYWLAKKIKPKWCSLSGHTQADVYASAMLSKGNFLYRLIFSSFFKKIRYEITSPEALKQAAQQGSIIYVQRQSGQLEFNYFQHLFSEENLPLSQFTNGISLRRFMPWPLLKETLLMQLKQISECGGIIDPISAGKISDLVGQGQPVLLHLLPTELEEKGVFLSYSQKLLKAALAKTNSDKPVFFVPLEFVWDRRPSRAKKSLTNILFGEKENPGAIRKAVLFWRSYHHRAVAKIGEPISAKEIYPDSTALEEKAAIQQASEKLLEVLNLERRAITGPLIRNRAWFVERVLIDEKFQNLVCELAAEMNKQADDLRLLARKYLKEIVADMNYTYIELGEAMIRWRVNSLYDGLTYNEANLQKLKKIYANKPLVFVPNHKSHLDYLLLSYILHNNYMTPPHVAAGINLSFWPLGKILRNCGAYFIRRSFEKNKLYQACVETYLGVLLEEGYSQEFFIEGGRSRTGKLSAPKFGMVRMLTKSVKDFEVEDIVFVPVSFAYDQVIEQKSYEKEVRGAIKSKERFTHFLRLFKYLKSQKQRHGKVYVNFGQPISYQDLSKKVHLERQTADLVNNICQQINRNLVVTPSALLASAILTQTQKGMKQSELIRRALLFLDYLKNWQRSIADSLAFDQEGAIIKAMQNFVDLGLVNLHEGFYLIDEEKRLQLDYYKNTSLHFLVEISIVANLLLRRLDDNVGFKVNEMLEDYQVCQKFLKFEFLFDPKEDIQQKIEQIFDFLIAKQALEKDQNSKFRLSNQAAQILVPFAGLLKNFFESQKIALNFLRRANFKKKAEKDLVKQMMSTGKNMYLLGHIKHQEAISKVNFANSLKLMCNFGLLAHHGVKMGSMGKKIFTSQIDNKLLQELQVQLERLA